MCSFLHSLRNLFHAVSRGEEVGYLGLSGGGGGGRAWISALSPWAVAEGLARQPKTLGAYHLIFGYLDVSCEEVGHTGSHSQNNGLCLNKPTAQSFIGFLREGGLQCNPRFPDTPHYSLRAPRLP